MHAVKYNMVPDNKIIDLTTQSPKPLICIMSLINISLSLAIKLTPMCF